MAEWPEELVALDTERGIVAALDAGPAVLIDPAQFRRYVPRQKVEEVERERDKALTENEGITELLAHFRDERYQLQATLDALAGEEALVALRDALTDGPVDSWRTEPDRYLAGNDPRPRRDTYLQAVEAALQAAKKQAGGGGE